ncbi:MAG: SapC family protein [Desulfovermiculus sp.]|nr:SapC family protein [Desulfovermiculus sp.]
MFSVYRLYACILSSNTFVHYRRKQKGTGRICNYGIYMISEKALNELDKETFADLRNNGALAFAYAQLFSMNQISRLSELAKYHAQQAQKQESSEPDIEQLFGDDDILSFDNI